MSMDEKKVQQLFAIARREARAYGGMYELTSLEFEDLVSCALERMVSKLTAGEQNCEAHLCNWARDGIGRAIHNEQKRPTPRGLSARGK